MSALYELKRKCAMYMCARCTHVQLCPLHQASPPLCQSACVLWLVCTYPEVTDKALCTDVRVTDKTLCTVPEATDKTLCTDA